MKRSRKSKTAWIIIITVALLTAILISSAIISYTTVAISLPDELPEKLSVKNIISGLAGDGHKSEKEKYNFLLLGKDSGAALCDVIMLASLDMKQGSLDVVQIPRDTYAKYGDASSSYKKINAAPYKLGNEGFMRFLEKNLGIDIDYYISVSLDAVVSFVDSIGGLDVNIPMDMDYDDEYQDLHIHLKAGQNKLNGDEAEQFIRFRAGYKDADIGRMNAQKIFMASMLDKLSNGVSIKTVMSAVTSLLGRTETNLTLVDCFKFMSYASEFDLNSVSFMTLPGNPAVARLSGAGYYVINRSAAIETVNRYLNVKKKDITESTFDTMHVFENKDYDDFVQIYNSKEYKIRAYSATEIMNGEIEFTMSENAADNAALTARYLHKIY